MNVVTQVVEIVGVNGQVKSEKCHRITMEHKKIDERYCVYIYIRI